ncbi:MAG: DUF1080 domain-containing protein [Planctomycetes bacterium]|nr:DUF1080 domain-containing protein [Planctomycetota bacterium]
MSRLLALIVLLASCVPGALAQEDAAPAPDDSWEVLFDGKNLDLWEVPFPDFWAVEEGVIRATLPEGATIDEKKAQGNWTWIKTKKKYRHFHVSLEVKAVRGAFGLAQWGTMKQFLDASFLVSDRWHTVAMTWRGGDVRLYLDGQRLQFEGKAREGENVREFFLLIQPDSEACFRNIRAKEID